MLGRADPLAEAGELARHTGQREHLQNLSPIMTLICHQHQYLQEVLGTPRTAKGSGSMKRDR
jgi:hypothetical protein